MKVLPLAEDNFSENVNMLRCGRVTVLTAGHCCVESATNQGNSKIVVVLGAYNLNIDSFADTSNNDRIEVIEGRWLRSSLSVPPAYWYAVNLGSKLYSFDLCVIHLNKIDHGIAPLPIGIFAVAETHKDLDAILSSYKALQVLLYLQPRQQICQSH